MEKSWPLILFMCAVGTASAQVFEMKTWRDLSDSEVSRMGRSVLSAARSPWIHAESAHFIYHSESLQELAQVAQEAEFAHAYIGDFLELAESHRKAHIYICVSERVWNRAVRIAGRRDDGIALHVGHEIFLHRPEGEAGNNMDLAHELVHFRIQHAFGRDMPLWLEEGLAIHLGWLTTHAYHATRDRTLFREMPALDEADLLEWEDIFAMRQYPAGRAATRSFYRLSAHLAAELIDRVEKDQRPLLLERMASGETPLAVVMEEEFELSQEEYRALLNAARAAAMREQRIE